MVAAGVSDEVDFGVDFGVVVGEGIVRNVLEGSRGLNPGWGSDSAVVAVEPGRIAVSVSGFVPSVGVGQGVALMTAEISAVDSDLVGVVFVELSFPVSFSIFWLFEIEELVMFSGV